jgi:hypothetical protein
MGTAWEPRERETCVVGSRYHRIDKDTTDWEDLVYAVMKCEVWSCSLSESPINTVTDPNTVYNHSYMRQYFKFTMKSVSILERFRMKQEWSIWQKTKSQNLNCIILEAWPPLWSSGQCSWLQIQRSWTDSLRYQIFWEVVGVERGLLSLMSTLEELLERKSSGSSLENRDYGRKGSAALTTRHPSIRKSLH